MSIGSASNFRCTARRCAGDWMFTGSSSARSLRQRHRLKWPSPHEAFCGFELLEEIGQGAIGRVYLAKQAALGDRTVVLKSRRAAADARRACWGC